MVTAFKDRLSEACRHKRSHIVVGIDPRENLLPEELKPRSHLPEVRAQAFLDFGKTVIDVCAPYTAAIKPQSAFFEALGSSGVAAFEAICVHARSRDLIVVGDLKRGDIGSTAEAYAEAAFRLIADLPLMDAVTVNPYLGSDGVLPFLAKAQEQSCGVYVLCKTSNPSSAELQDLELANSQIVHEHMADLINSWNMMYPGVIGAVVGGTHPELLPQLRRRMPDIPFLIPGVGAQGATMLDAVRGFSPSGELALVNSSRGITFPWAKTGSSPEDWPLAIARAAEQARDELNAALSTRQP